MLESLIVAGAGCGSLKVTGRPANAVSSPGATGLPNESVRNDAVTVDEAFGPLTVAGDGNAAQHQSGVKLSPCRQRCRNRWRPGRRCTRTSSRWR